MTRRWHTAPAEALPFTDTERPTAVGTFVGIDGAHRTDTEPSLLDALAEATDAPQADPEADALGTGDAVTFTAMRGDSTVTVAATVEHTTPGATWTRVTTESGHTTEVRTAYLTRADVDQLDNDDADPEAWIDARTEAHATTPRDRDAARAECGDAWVAATQRAALTFDLANVVRCEARDAARAAAAGTDPALDLAARLVPARWQYRLAAALLAPVLAADPEDTGSWLVAVPLALPRKDRGMWFVGQEVRPVPGAWLVRVDAEAGPYAYRAGSLAAEDAGRAFLDNADGAGTVAVAMIDADGHAAVTEY